ncbi:MAG: hypothetical protein KKH04_20245 [Proteobacteria bacterium]|nr:hypothetical protein [Pseudomonadota bacterium]
MKFVQGQKKNYNFALAMGIDWGARAFSSALRRRGPYSSVSWSPASAGLGLFGRGSSLDPLHLF